MLRTWSKSLACPVRHRTRWPVWGACSCACLLLMLAMADAAPVEGLYEAEVPATGLSGNALEEAFSRALGEVLVKVTGSRMVFADPANRRAVGSPGPLVRQYQPAAGGQLRVRFDPVAVRERLDAAALPVWGSERPLTLVLVPADILQAELTDPTLVPGPPAPAPATDQQLILDTAARRGLTVRLGAGTPEDAVPGASGAPAGEPVLVARRLAASGGGMYSWTLLQGTDRAEWQGGAADGIHGLADRLAARYASVATTGQPIRLLVDDITSFDAYGRLLSYLRSLGLIQTASLEQVSGGTLVFQLAVRGNVAQLQDVLALQRVLEPGDRQATADANELRYRFAGRP